MRIDEYKVRLGGLANIPRDLELGKSFDLVISNAEIRSKEAKPNDDGTANMILKLVISELSEVNIIGQHEVIPATKKGSQSKKLRFEIIKLAEKLNEDPDAYYQSRMTDFIKQIQEEYESL